MERDAETGKLLIAMKANSTKRICQVTSFPAKGAAEFQGDLTVSGDSNNMISQQIIEARSSSCLSQIEGAYSRLQGSMRQVAESLLRAPREYVGKSISKLAQDSHVSDATVLRFVRSIGYSGFRSFALALATSVSGTRAVDEKLTLHISERDELDVIVKKVFEAESKALLKAPQTLGTGLVQRAVTALAKARLVYTYAVGSSGFLAGEAEYRLARLGIQCTAIHDPIQMAIHASRLTSRDIVIGFSQTGRNRASVEGLELARKSGAVTIGITSKPGSPLSEASDIPLVLFELSTVFHGAFLDSKIAELTLIDALATCIASRHESRREQRNRVDFQIEHMLIKPAGTRSNSKK